jgi:multidrug efflux pump subunit AcrA (membrane-fusion protein)
MDILYLIDRLDNLIASSRRMPLLNQIMLKEGDILSVIDQMRASIPDEVKQARRIIQEKDRILSQAQAEASNLLAQARLESERALEREGLLEAAEERSQEIIQQAKGRSQAVLRHAEEEADRLKIEADSYVTETLRALREHLLSIETDVGRTIMSIERGLETMETTPEEPEMVDEMDEGRDVADNRPSQQSPIRRASLAADTMGGPNFQS